MRIERTELGGMFPSFSLSLSLSLVNPSRLKTVIRKQEEPIMVEVTIFQLVNIIMLAP